MRFVAANTPASTDLSASTDFSAPNSMTLDMRILSMASSSCTASSRKVSSRRVLSLYCLLRMSLALDDKSAHG